MMQNMINYDEEGEDKEESDEHPIVSKRSSKDITKSVDIPA